MAPHRHSGSRQASSESRATDGVKACTTCVSGSRAPLRGPGMTGGCMSDFGKVAGICHRPARRVGGTARGTTRNIKRILRYFRASRFAPYWKAGAAPSCAFVMRTLRVERVPTRQHGRRLRRRLVGLDRPRGVGDPPRMLVLDAAEHVTGGVGSRHRVGADLRSRLGARRGLGRRHRGRAGGERHVFQVPGDLVVGDRDQLLAEAEEPPDADHHGLDPPAGAHQQILDRPDPDMVHPDHRQSDDLRAPKGAGCRRGQGLARTLAASCAPAGDASSGPAARVSARRVAERRFDMRNSTQRARRTSRGTDDQRRADTGVQRASSPTGRRI